MLVVNSMKWLMSWQIRAVPLTKNLSSLGRRNLAPATLCQDVNAQSIRVRESMRTLLDDLDENIGHLLQRDGAPNKSLLKSITAVNTMRAAKLHSTIFVCAALLRLLFRV